MNSKWGKEDSAPQKGAYTIRGGAAAAPEARPTRRER